MVVITEEMESLEKIARDHLVLEKAGEHPQLDQYELTYFLMNSRGFDILGLVVNDYGEELWYRQNALCKPQLFKSWHDFESVLSEGDKTVLRNLNHMVLKDAKGDIVESLKISEAEYKLQDCNANSTFSPTTLIAQLWARIIELETKLNEVYNAPGMPGFVQACDHFSNVVESSGLIDTDLV